MKRITAQFNTVDFADFAAGALRRSAGAIRITCRSAKRDTDGTVVNYPIRPQYLMGSPMQYLNGLPHILDDKPLSLADNNARNEKAVLSFSVEDENVSLASSIIHRFGGHSVKIK